MANLTDIITQELPTKADREEFARKAREARDYYNSARKSPRQFNAWNRILIAAEREVVNARITTPKP